MTNWVFTTPTVDEAPFSWSPLMQRYRITRGISIVETSPCVYQQVRYDAYTNEIGAVNLPDNPNANDVAFWPAPQAGLHYFRGGYEWLVDDATKACLIASGVGVSEDNFQLPPDTYGAGDYGDGLYGF
jgi:hypothetical protein